METAREEGEEKKKGRETSVMPYIYIYIKSCEAMDAFNCYSVCFFEEGSENEDSLLKG